MLRKDLRPGYHLSLLERRHAEELFRFVREGRERFLPFIPFASKVKEAADALGYIERFLKLHAEGAAYFYGLWHEARLIGMVLIKDIEPAAGKGEIGYMIDAAYEGKGLVREACLAMLDFMTAELGLRKASLCCDPRNERSVALARALGFHLEGTLEKDMLINGELVDTMHWARFAGDAPPAPAGRLPS